MTPKTVRYIREGMHAVNPYLVVNGADRQLRFVTNVFDGQERLRVPAEDGQIRHAEIKIGDMVLELADGNGNHPAHPMSLHVYVKDVDAAYGRALEQSGTTPLYAPVDQDYGDREASVRDASGTTWYVATHKGSSYQRPGLLTVTPYLHVKESAEFVVFLKKAFGAVEADVMAAPEGNITYGQMRIGDSTIELSEVHGQWGPMSGNLQIYVPDTDATYTRALDAGARSLQTPVDTPHGDRSAGVEDAWGTRWWISTWLGQTVG